jgi:taurine dioxygenase
MSQSSATATMQELLLGRPMGPIPMQRVAEGSELEPYERIEVRPMSPTIGAEVAGVDLATPLDEATHDEVHRALLEWKVLFFRDQHLSVEQHVAFARTWGDIEEHPFLPKGSSDTIQRFEKGPQVGGYENEWHHDNTWRLAPSMGAVLRAVEVPPVGGDTLFVDTAAAYDNLRDDVKARIDGLQATHDWINAFGRNLDDERRAELRALLPTVVHPVVRTHPETGRRSLFVNRVFTTGVVGMELEEAAELLDFLCRQSDRPEYQCRRRWEAGMVAFWDNRAVQHYAVSDYWPARRVMERVAIVGDVPF